MSNWTFLNRHRLRSGPYGSNNESGFNGAFGFALPGEARMICVIASDGAGWRHVSVSFGKGKTATPSWSIMCQVKDLFWEPEDCVMQLHPPRSQYVNFHPGTLHLWQPLQASIPMPPRIMV